MSAELHSALHRYNMEVSAATAYFHTWWGLTNTSLLDHYATMSDYRHVDFFHTAHAGFLALTFVSLAKLFDSDGRALGIRNIRTLLTESGFGTEAAELEDCFKPYSDLVRRILQIRNRSEAHNEAELSRDDVYRLYGVAPDEIRELITAVRNGMNSLASKFQVPTRISDGQRNENAVSALMEMLQRGRR